MSSSMRSVGVRDATPDRKVVKQELDAVQTIATNAAAAAAEKPDWNALGGAANEILNKPTIPGLNDTLTSTSTTEAATARTVKEINDKLEGIGDGQVVDTMTDRDNLTGLDAGDMITVLDRGDGKWQDFKVVSTTDGTAANSVFAPRLDQDALAGAASATNLSNTPSTTEVTLESSTGADTSIAAVSATQAGVQTVAQFNDQNDRGGFFPIPGNNVLASFAINVGYTDDVLDLSLWEVATQEYVDIKMVRAKNSGTVTVGPFETAPPNAISYELHVHRG